MKKNKRIRLAVWMMLLCLGMTACGNTKTAEESTTQVETAAEETTISETEMAAEKSTAAESAETEAPTETETTEAVQETEELSWETLAAEDVDVSSYEISSGTWFYTGIEDEKSIDMDGLKGFTAYTTEAIPETEGYLQYLGINPNGHHVFDVYDIYGAHFTTMTFVSEEQFYLGGDETEFYIKWNY